MKKRLALLMALLFTLSFVVACSTDSKTAAGDSDTIKVGLNYELSGPVSTYGQSLTSGVELAIDEINKNGGVLGKQIEAVKIDNRSDTTEVANVSTRLATRDNVVAILGPATSGNTKAASPAAMENKVPLISASATDDDVTVDSNGNVREYIFKTCFSDSFQGVTMANFAYGDLASKKVAILFDNTNDYAKGLKKSFKSTYEKLGGNVLVEEGYQAKDTDFKAVLTNIKATNPEVLYVPGYYEEVGLIVRQARELGITVPILGGDGYDSPKLAEIAGSDSLNKVYYTNHYSSMDTAPEIAAFREAFKAEYSKEPDAFNALGYDLAYFLADAIERAGSPDREKIKEALASTVDFNAITGTLSIDENHNPIKAVTILEVVDGVPTFLKKLEP